MWECSICAASYQSKQWATRHIKYHHISNQKARVVCIHTSTIAPSLSPILLVKTVTSDHVMTNAVTKHANSQNDTFIPMALLVPQVENDTSEDEVKVK